MSTVPEVILDTLNGLLEGHLNSIFHFVVSSSPHMSEATADLRQLIQEIDQVCKRETQDLVQLIESLGGVPRVRNRVAPEEQYLSFLSLKFLLPTLVNEKDLLLLRSENARATIGENYPQVTEVLKRIETEQCIYIERLKAAASILTHGKYEPPKHSQRCSERAK
jgi:hypothetical protein